MIFDFIWHMRGSIALDASLSDEEALRRIERLIARQSKTVASRDAEQVTFESPLENTLLGLHFPPMKFCDGGRFWIEQGTAGRVLRYDLRSLHFLMYCLLAAFVFFHLGSSGKHIVDGLKSGAFALICVYGGNTIFAFIRVPGAIRRAIEAA